MLAVIMRTTTSLILISAGLLLAACGGSSTDVEPAAVPASSYSAKLPAPGQLIGLERAAAIAGPGWHSLAAAPDSATFLQHAVSEGAEGLFFDEADSAWRIWPVDGFTDDMRPTSLRADVTEGSGPYVLGWVDYASGRWQFSELLDGDATLEYDGDPDSRVSTFDRHFAVMIAPQGSEVELLSLDLGVDGGEAAPLRVDDLYDHSNSSQVAFSWTNSRSHIEADFAGYLVEFAPIGSSSFSRLTDQPVKATSWVDTEAVEGIDRRYRVASVDTSGNMAYSPVREFGYRSGGSPPVGVLEISQQSLYGPTTVRFDMSASYDPDDDIIAGYQFQVGDDGEKIDSASAALELTVQPGCYRVLGRIAAGGEFGYALGYLRVHPQWLDPVVIDSGADDGSYSYDARGIVDQADGSELYIYAETTVPGIGAICIRPDGSILRDFLPVYGTVYGLLGNLVIHNGRPVAPVVFGGYVHLLEWDGDSLEYTDYLAVETDSSYSSLASDGQGRLWLLHYTEGTTNHAISLHELFSGLSINLVNDIAVGRVLSCLYNPASDSVDCIFSTDKLYWARVKDNMITGGAELNDSWVLHQDIALNPANGRPALCYKDGVEILYRELMEDDTDWTTPVSVDSSLTAGSQHELEFLDGEAIVSMLDSVADTLLLYSGGTGGFDSIGELPHANASNHALIANTSQDSLGVLDLSSDGMRHAYRRTGNGPFESLLDEPGQDSQGRFLSAAAGYDGLHVAQVVQGKLRHYRSDDGSSWNEMPDLGDADALQLGADEAGSLMLAQVENDEVNYNFWTEGAGYSQTGFLPIEPDSIPVVSEQGVRILLYDKPGVDQLYAVTGLIANDVPWSHGTLWTGAAVMMPGDEPVVMGYYSGDNPNEAYFGLVDYEADEAPDSVSAGFVVERNMVTEGRWADGAVFFDYGKSSLRPVFWQAYDGLGNARRVDYDYMGNGTVASLSFRMESGPFFDPAFLERTASAAQARGYTAVGLVSDSAGDRQYFEWSNFGDWQSLPLPDIRFMSKPELAVGEDGRWHIVYHDLVTDDIMVVSTP